MNKKLLTTQILLALAVSASVCTTGMALNLGPIEDNYAPEQPTNEEINVINENEARAAIKFDEDSSVDQIDVALETGPDEHGITLESAGSGIHTSGGAGTISLTSTADNTINFNEGKGIYIEDDTSVTLDAAAENCISRGEGEPTGEEDYDGINAGGTGTISLTGAKNTIDVQQGTGSDGIYTVAGSDKNVTLTATTGSNTLAAGNNGIDHRGTGTITLTAESGINNINTTNGNGVRVDGTGIVVLEAQQNMLNAGDNGIQVSDGGISAIKGQTNNITGINGIDVGNDSLAVVIGQGGKGINQIIGTGVTTEAGKENGYGIRVDDGVAIIIGEENTITGGNTGIYTFGNGTTIISGTTNDIQGGDGDKNYGIEVSGGGTVNIKGTTNTISGGDGLYVFNEGTANIFAQNSNTITGKDGNGITADGGSIGGGIVNVVTTDGETQIRGSDGGIFSAADSKVSIESSGENWITGEDAAGVSIQKNGIVNITSTNASNYILGQTVAVDLQNNDVKGLINRIEAYKDNILTGETSHGVSFTTSATLEIVAKTGSNSIKGNVNSIGMSGGGRLIMDAAQGINTVFSKNGRGASIGGASTLEMRALKNTITAVEAGVFSTENSLVSINALGEGNSVKARDYGAVAQNSSTIELLANQGKNEIIASGSAGHGIWASDGSDTKESAVNLTASSNFIKAGKYGARADAFSFVTMQANQSNNEIQAGQYGIYTVNGGHAELFAKQANVVEAGTYGARVDPDSFLKMTASESNNEIRAGQYGIYTVNSGHAELSAKQANIVSGENDGLIANNGTISLDAGTDNQIESAQIGLNSYMNADISLTASGNNLITAGTVDSTGFGTGKAIYARTQGTITLSANQGSNSLSGAVHAIGQQTGDDTDTVVSLTGAANAVYSAATIADAGDLNQDTSFDGKSVISALYAEDGATITVDGSHNEFHTLADPDNTNQLERTIWAYNGADITVNGESTISTNEYERSPNSLDVAIAAGTAVGLDAVDVAAPVADRATVTLNYDGTSAITGDILAAYAGQVDIAAKEGSHAGLAVTGNILAGNNGVLNLDLGEGGTLTGRADDYGDAGVIDGSGHGTSFFDPAFSSSILKGGVVNLKMGNNSRWNVTGQSWITSIDTTGSSNAVIDLISSNTDRNSTAHALTIYDMKGNAAFNMSLDADRSVSDMLYMKKADGSYLINVYDGVTEEDMYADGFDGLRFATVGEGSNVSFRAITYGQGIINREYEIGTDAYNGNKENAAYNSTDGSGAGNTQKPGTALVDGFFTSDGTPGSTTEGTGTETETPAAKNAVMALAAAEETAPAADAETGTNPGNENTAVEDNANGATNYKLIAVKNEETSNAGKTIIAMSRVNYANAVYMDRLNKRMGEARYIDGDDGLWVRLRHDRIGKDDAFRSMNTMFELGYDWHAKGQQDGEHRQGVAFDYMRGTADYQNVAGDGDVRRAGVWLYDTWLGDKGHYSDYVVKYGRLSNDFDIYGRSNGEKISGDYDNDVWSVSAEYGRKKDIGNDWYFEPQVQAQYAYVTSADYTTSQGTKVELDGIDSLIGRAGFRLGRDTSEGNTVYFKADILHEFLGDQSIRATDTTGTLDTTYENEGTWYDVGFGFSHKMGEDSYLFLDVEHSFGNDNDDTYQVNIGLNRAF